MSSFQFPANPSDGDIVVRGNLQAFYNAATNTWRVSEVPTAPGIPGPPGPPGPIGPPGQGVSISGSVDTFANLPAPNTAQFNFWIVDDTNTLYYSDGTQWIDFGSPIRGPQGEPGEDGADGTNGQNGRGWYDTNIIDNGSEYKIEFLSNDGLGFVTDNLKGEKGDDGDLKVATATTLGGIKIGRGLNIKPDGTVNAGETAVDLETVPLSPEGTVYSYYIGLKPIVIDWDATHDTSLVLQDRGLDPAYGGIGPQMGFVQTPVRSIGYDQLGDANAAIIFFQARNQFRKAPGNNPGTVKYYRSYSAHSLRITGATFTNTGATYMGFPVTHNVTIPGNMSYNDRRSSNAAFSKNQIIKFTPGATITFQHVVDILSATQSITDCGSARVVVIPFKIEGDITGFDLSLNDPNTFFARNQQEWEDVINEYLPPQTPEEAVAEQSQQLKDIMRETLTLINDSLDYVNDVEKAQLLTYRDQIMAAKTLPGDFIDLQEYLLNIEAQVLAIVGFKFRFEP